MSNRASNAAGLPIANGLLHSSIFVRSSRDRPSFVKSDSCAATHVHEAALAEYAKLGAALKATGRDIVHSGCGWMKWSVR